MKRFIYIIMALGLVAAASSCEKMGAIGGSVNSTEKLDITTSQWLAAQDETAVVATLFEKAGLTDIINGPVTVISPNKWSVNRYIRRHNSMTRKAADDAPYDLDSLYAEDLSRMKMYIFDGVWPVSEIPDEGVFLTSIDGSQEIYLSYDENNTDPTAGWDGGNAAGAGYQYSNFLMTTPKVLHVIFKRGENWELKFAERLGIGFDKEECDQAYKMYVSDIKTSNGVVHVLYVGDSLYDEQFHYHSLFFYGTRNDDK